MFTIVGSSDERTWDAFISYKSNTPDEDFVIRTLFPKLTRDLGFSINVHFKDFVAGEGKYKRPSVIPPVCLLDSDDIE